ncbi:MAG: AAA family ATPase [Luteitalea sp.]
MNDIAHQKSQPLTADEARALVSRVADARTRVLTELRKSVIGQEASVDLVLAALFAGGHCLLTGVPGLAKTLLVRTLAQVLDLGFRRIQFTPDLMPSDITGTEVLDETDGIRALRFVRGPVFTQLLLADEINRTPPKTQAALLEAMQEGHVTAAGRSYQLEPPFFVLATQNPIELEGTYPLPEAQLDRFLFNIVMIYLPEDDEVTVVTQTTGVARETPQRVLSREDILQIQGLVRHVVIAEDVARYAVRLSAATRPTQPDVPDFVKRYVKWGAGLRASQALVLGAKARALTLGRAHVTPEDIRVLAPPVFRHRVLINFQAESEGLTTDAIVLKLLERVAPPASGLA